MALCIFFALVTLAARSAFKASGALRIALVTALLVWAVTSITATVEENRTTWLLLAVCVLAGRLATEDRSVLTSCFANRGSDSVPTLSASSSPPFNLQPDS